MKVKKIIKLLLLVTIASLALIACNHHSQEVDANHLAKGEKPSLLDKENTDDEEVKDVWTDTDGLIKIWREGKDCLIYYDINQWEKIHQITEYNKIEYPNTVLADRPLVIKNLEEDVKDVAIVSIEGYGGSYDNRNNFPMVFMLMESGEVTWLRGYPPMDSLFQGEDKYIQEEEYSYGYLPYLKDIESFAYESDGEGIGEMTLFAIDKKGLRYDVRHVIDLEALVYGQYSVFPVNDYDGQYFQISLDLSEDGHATMSKIIDRGIEVGYEGVYEMHLDDSSSKGIRAPGITLDLKLENQTNESYQVEPSFKGTFMLSEDQGEIIFCYSQGDPFEEGIDCFRFQAGPYGMEDEPLGIWYLTGEEFIDYFLYVMVDTQDKIENQGMFVLVDGDSTELVDYGYCRDIALGTNHNGSFVKEYHYTVTSEGAVFEYDPLEDLWQLRYYPGDPLG